jgi:hypothetical protein
MVDTRGTSRGQDARRDGPREITSQRDRSLLLILGALVAIAGVTIRLATLGHDSLNCDELYTQAVIKLDAWSLAFVNFDVHPPLFNLIEKALSALGSTEFQLRLAPALFGIANSAVAFDLARRRLGLMEGVVAGALTLLSYKFIAYSSIARDYSLLAFALLAAAATLSQITERFLADPKERQGWFSGSWALYAFLAFAALMSHVVAAPYLIVLNAMLLMVVALEQPTVAVGFARRLALANLVPFSVFTVWYVRAMSTTADFQWLDRFPPLRAAEILVAAFSPTNLPHAIALVTVVAVAAGAAVSLTLRPRTYAAVTLTFLVLGPVSLFIISLVKPVFMERTIILAAPGAALATAALVRYLRPAALASLVAVGLVGVFLASAILYTQRGFDKESLGMEPAENYREALQLIDRDLGAKTVVLTCEGFTDPAFAYYGRKPPYLRYTLVAGQPLVRVTGSWLSFYGRPSKMRAPNQWTTPSVDGLSAADRVIYLDIPNFCAPEGDRPAQLLRSQGFHETRSKHVQGMDVRVFDRDGVVNAFMEKPQLHPVATGQAN